MMPHENYCIHVIIEATRVHVCKCPGMPPIPNLDLHRSKMTPLEMLEKCDQQGLILSPEVEERILNEAKIPDNDNQPNRRR